MTRRETDQRILGLKRRCAMLWEMWKDRHGHRDVTLLPRELEMPRFGLPDWMPLLDDDGEVHETIDSLVEKAIPKLRGRLSMSNGCIREDLKALYKCEVSGFTSLGYMPIHDGFEKLIRHDETGRMFRMHYDPGSDWYEWSCKLGHEMKPGSDEVLREIHDLKSRMETLKDQLYQEPGTMSSALPPDYADARSDAEAD